MKKVSVIIPAYNHEKLIEKCVRSVMQQTCPELEILVINDGSTDQTGAVLDRLAAEDARICVFHQENRGVSEARNRGVEMATGEYITFIDGDDYVGEAYIERMVKSAEAEAADMVICGLTKVTANGEILEEIIPGKYEQYTHEEWTFRISAVCSHLYRRELWVRHSVRFCPGVRGEDMPVSLFFSAICRNIQTIPDREYYYVQHAGSAMHNFKGLGTYRLPYDAIEEAIFKAETAGIANSPENFELFVMRILATCFFQLAAGASHKKMKELCDFIIRILQGYFPEYYKNEKTRLWADIDVPFTQKIAVKLLILLVRTKTLYVAGRMLSRK